MSPPRIGRRRFPASKGINRQSQDHYSERTLGDSAGLTARLLDADRTRETSRACGAGAVRRWVVWAGPGALARDRGSLWRRGVALDHDRGALGALRDPFSPRSGQELAGGQRVG